MKEFIYTVTDPQGIHARPAGELVKLAKEFTSSVTIQKTESQETARKSLLLWDLELKAAWKSYLSLTVKMRTRHTKRFLHL